MSDMLEDKKKIEGNELPQIENHEDSPKIEKVKAKRMLTDFQRNVITLFATIFVLIILFFAIFLGFRSIFINKFRTVDNQVTLTITGIEKVSNLRVLGVAGTSIEPVRDTRNGIVAVYQFYGHGYYAIDLTKANFSADPVNNVVFIELPDAEFSAFKLDADKTHKVTFDNAFGNDSEIVGQRLGDELYRRAHSQIEGKLNRFTYLQLANENAKKIIEQYVKNLNPEIRELKVVFL